MLPLLDEIENLYEIWDNEKLDEQFPRIDVGRHGPPKRMDDEEFWADTTEQLSGAAFCPVAGYISDPQQTAHNLQRAAEAKGTEFRFNTEILDIHSENGRAMGVTLADGTEVDTGIVINVAGLHSFVIREIAGIADAMNVTIRALRHEVHHVFSPAALDFEAEGMLIGDDETDA